MAPARQSLEAYRAKRDFANTPEPDDAPSSGSRAEGDAGLAFVIQKHAASRLHYDFRLELDGVLLSWAVPKGPSFDPADKRMAVRTEDHPLGYASFEGTIPPKHYGAGTVIVWDRGSWAPVGDATAGLAAGKLVFDLDGEKLAGRWELVRIQKKGEKQEPWLLFKKRDAWARPAADYDVVQALPDSIVAKPLGRLLGRGGGEDGIETATATATATATTIAHDAAVALAAAPKAALPKQLEPQLATLAATPAAVRGDGWLYEIKFDGYRVLARFERGTVRLDTRNGNDWTKKMPGMAAAFEALGVAEGWLDGELVVMGDDGTPDFNALQNAFDHRRTDSIVCFLFDAPFLDGRDLRGLPLATRRAILEHRLGARLDDRIRLSTAFDGDAASVLDSARRMHLEGVIAKRRDAVYEAGRSTRWLKLKCQQRQEFVIGGYTERTGAVGEVGSLLLGVHEGDAGGELRSVGSVGTGWDAKTAAALHEKLMKLAAAASPFAADAAPARGRWARRTAGGERWVKPELVAEVAFAEWTPDGQVRHAIFHALRSDKPARSVSREQAVEAPVAASAAARKGKAVKSAGAATDAAAAAAVRISNPKRVIDATTHLTKLDLVRYYESVADRILPHLAGRPVSLVRGPKGVAGTLFFQKHGEKIGIPGIVELDAALWPGHQALLEVNSVEALVGCAQMNVIEFHTWNSTVNDIDRPDRIVFDLDPGEGVGWPQVQEAAILVRAMLEELGLESWLKTSGGKGLHLVVPIVRRLGYDAVKAFSQQVVQHLAETIPQRFVAKSGGANRVGKIFVDYLRNGHGATTAAAFSARARPGLGVSMPVAWEALASLKGGAHWSIATAREHLSFERVDPWAGYWKAKQPLGAAIKALAG